MSYLGLGLGVASSVERFLSQTRAARSTERATTAMPMVVGSIAFDFWLFVMKCDHLRRVAREKMSNIIPIATPTYTSQLLESKNYWDSFFVVCPGAL